MEIDHISFSPSGGAGQVATSLVNAQKSLGHDARLFTLNAEDLRSQPFEHLSTTAAAGIDEYILKGVGSPALISIMRRKIQRISDMPLRDDSTIHLHWIEGVIDHGNIKMLLDSGRKVLWTMHDAAPFSGGCHATLGCSGFKTNCSNCPQVKPLFRNLVERSHKERQGAGLRGTNLGIVAPSHWLAAQIESSSLFMGQSVSVIKNPVADYFFQGLDRAKARSSLGIAADTFVAIVISAQLNNTLKRVKPLVEKFNKLATKTASSSLLLLVGDGGAEFERLSTNARWLGKMAHKDIPEVLAAADCLIVTSDSESSGLTIREAAALGVPSLIIENGGSEELVIDSYTGFVCRDFDAMESRLKELMVDTSTLRALGANARTIAMKESHPSEVAARYLEEYSRLS
jgi:glycosyltransferase involved in cell wall biosynthesis